MKLYPTWTLGDLNLTDWPFSVEFGSENGEPSTEVEIIESMLFDGELEEVTGHGNRDVNLTVLIEGPSLGAIAQHEAALRAEATKKRNRLTLDPGDGVSPPAVFEVLWVSMRHVRNDAHEAATLRRWELTVRCAPFAMSAELVVVEPYTPGATTVSVDTCDSTAGWTATRYPNASVPVQQNGSAVGVLDAGSPSPLWTMVRTGAVDFTDTPFLAIEAAIPFAATQRLTARADATLLPLVEVVKIADGESFYRLTFDASAVSSAAALSFATTASSIGFFVRQVSRSSVPPGTTARQVTRVIEPGGTERTPASIHVDAGADVGLGLTFVHTSPDDGSGYSPPMRRWRVSGNGATTASDTFSGAYEAIHPAAVVSEVPASTLPEATYALVTALKTDTPGTHAIAWSLQSRFPPSTFGEGGYEGSTDVTFWNTTDYHLAPLAVVTLPTIRATDSAVVRAAIQYQGSEPLNIVVDDFWLFRVDDGCALTIVNHPPRHLWLDSPDVSSPVPRVWQGASEDRSDQRHPGEALMAMGSHILDAKGTAVFTATRNVNHPRVSASFYRRWHSNAGE